MSQFSPYIEIKFIKNVTLEDRLKTHDVSEFAIFIECDLKYPDNIN